MSLLHLLLPLDPESLNKCINLLSTNENAKPIDFLRINALRFASTRNETEQNLIIKTCSQLFDLENPKELLIFSNWLAKLKAFPSLIEYLPSSKAKTDENLFKIRMNALANLKDVASIHQEVKGAVIIPTRWRIVVEARALTLTGKFKEASIVLDRLPPILGDDFRKAISVCEYLEASGDVIALIHVLETLIEEPIHQRYALQKLLQYRSASAPLEDLLDWMSKLSQMEENPTSFFRNLPIFRTSGSGSGLAFQKANRLAPRSQGVAYETRFTSNSHNACFGAFTETAPRIKLS